MINDHKEFTTQLSYELKLILEYTFQRERSKLIGALILPRDEWKCMYGHMFGHCNSTVYKAIAKRIPTSIAQHKWLNPNYGNGWYTPLEVALTANENLPDNLNQLRDYIIQQHIPTAEELYNIVENISIEK